MSDSVSKEGWWDRHKAVLILILDVSAAAISPWGTWSLTSNLALAILSVLFGPLIMHSMLTMLDFNAKYPEMRRNTLSVMGLVRGVAEALEDAHSLDRGMREISLSFAIRSLNGLTKRGFLEVDIRFYDFLDYVQKLSRETARKIFGTSTVRRPKELAMHEFSKKYLAALLANADHKLMRVTVLDRNHVTEIVKEAIEKLEVISPPRPPKEPIHDFPEVEWWTTKGNQVPYISKMKPNVNLDSKRILLWTTHEIALARSGDNNLIQSTLRPGTTDDYAVFDDTVVLKFRENSDVERGILFLLWGAARVEEYTKSFIQVETALNPKTTLSLSDLGLFASFYELLANIGPSLSLDVSAYEAVRSCFPSATVTLADLYAKVIDAVNGGSVGFSPEYLHLFVN